MSEQHETEQQRETRDVITEALGDALVREAIGLIAVAVVLLAMDQRFRIWLRGELAWLRGLGRRPGKAAEDEAVARLQRDISEFEHKTARGRDGGCGCA